MVKFLRKMARAESRTKRRPASSARRPTTIEERFDAAKAAYIMLYEMYPRIRLY